jgi:glycosyltransferase involved in cell wall biosynthesis
VKVLLVAHSFPRDPDDMAGSFLLALARELSDRGHRLLALAPHAPGTPLHDQWGDLTIERYRYGRDDQETLAYVGTMHEQVLTSWSARWRLLVLMRAAVGAVRDAVRRFQPDVTHVHWWFPGGYAVWPFSAGGTPWVLTSHGTDLFLLDRFPAMRIAARPLFRRAAQVTVISTPLVPRVEKMGVARDRITVIPMPRARAGLDAPLPEERRESDHLLFVGRLVERKGAEYAIRALRVLVERGHRLRLTLVGDGPERESLEQLTDRLEIRDRVTFVGAIPPADVGRWYRRAAVLLFPTVTDWKGEQEGFGMVLVEAMHAGVPIVASRSGGIPDVILDHETGRLVPERDVGAIADAVAGLVADPDLRARLTRAALDDVQRRFAPTAIAERFESVYTRAVASERR